MKLRLYLLLLRVRNHLLMILVQVDILLFVAFGGGQRDESFCARVYALELAERWQGRLARPVIDGLMWIFEPGHCQQAWLDESHTYERRWVDFLQAAHE